jgi:nucleotide-binding universal stress UspA family protein
MTEIERETNEIVVAQDGSPAALSAASVAIQIARSQGLSIRGLYVVDETLALEIYADYHGELERDAEPSSRAELVAWFEEQGDAALQMLEVRCQAAGVPVTTELVAGGVEDMVLREAEQASLLAIGRRGHSQESDPDHLGRTFRAIAHAAHLPLIVGGNEERTVRRLLLAYDGAENTRPSLLWASVLQRTLAAEVAVVAVQEYERQPTGEWLAEAQTQLENCQCMPRLGQPVVEILAAAEEMQADLIVMGRHGRAALLEWLTGSTVDRVLRGTQLPVLLA